MINRLQAVVEHPFHKYLRISDVGSEDGNGSMTFIAGKKFINPAGVLHGGIIYVLCDVCSYAGLLSILSPEKEAFTHDISISIIRAAKLGDVVKIKSHIVKLGKTLCFADATATVSGDIIATARVTKSLVTIKK